MFYLGREIAQVMGHEGADWLDRPEREAEEAPTLLLRALKLKPGQAIADIGAGSGYFSLRLARLVGPKGRVYAVDIQPEMLDILRQKSRAANLRTIEPVLGTVSDPKLPAESVDLCLLVDVYHEFDHPFEMTRAMIKALKIGGRLVLVEYRQEDPRVPIKLVHKLSEAQARKEMAIHPELRFARNIGVLPRQHILIFEKVAPPAPTR
jgi:ubiquinone/menaquinone biosynthesis C-methylase UbiE